jgi:hypothetical protein
MTKLLTVDGGMRILDLYGVDTAMELAASSVGPERYQWRS